MKEIALKEIVLNDEIKIIKNDIIKKDEEIKKCKETTIENEKTISKVKQEKEFIMQNNCYDCAKNQDCGVILECKHLICINCASKLHRQEKKYTSGDKVVCLKCMTKVKIEDITFKCGCQSSKNKILPWNLIKAKQK